MSKYRKIGLLKDEYHSSISTPPLKLKKRGVKYGG